MSLQRAHDWPEQLAAYIDERRQMPFAWGTNDCALFSADFVLRITGVDLAEGRRGYRTERIARRHVLKAGGMRGLADGLRERPLAFSQRGDIVLVDIEGRESFGLCIGSGTWAGPGAAGLVFRPMSDVITTFEY